MTETDKDNGGFTLDKIEISPKNKQPPAIGDTPGKDIKKDKTGTKKAGERERSTLKNILAYISKQKLYICLILAALLIILSAIIALTSYKHQAGHGPKARMAYKFDGALGDKYRIKFKLLIPFKDQKEKTNINQKLKRLKHELIITGSHPDIEKLVRQNEYEALKKEISEIIHILTAVPVQKISIKDLTLEKS